MVLPPGLLAEYEQRLRELRVGRTPLLRADRLGPSLGVGALHLKEEGANPTRTHKDRLALLQALDAREKGYHDLAVATCGNFGMALAFAADAFELKAHIFFPAPFPPFREAELEALGATVERVPGDYRATIEHVASHCHAEGWYDANPGPHATEFALAAYAVISGEILEALPGPPDFAAVPIGNGSTFAGVHQGFARAGARVSLLGTSNNNAIVRGWLEGKMVPVPVPDVRITAINDPLSGNDLYDAEAAFQALRESGGQAFEVSDEEMLDWAARLEEQEQVRAQPASASTLGAVARVGGTDRTFVAVLTGGAV